MKIHPIILLASFVGCAASTTRGDLARKTTLRLAPTQGCKAGVCRCRALEGGGAKELGIPTGYKRFEFRLPRSTSAIWVEVKDHGVFYKPPSTVDPQCFYLDLDPGPHGIRLHARGADPQVGMQTGLTIFEYAEPALAEGRPHWYRSFHMACGKGASACSRDEMDAWSRFIKGLPRGVLAPCGSVMAKSSGYSGQRRQKGDDTYQSLVLSFRLKIYRFKPHRPPGSVNCKAPSKNR